MPTDFSARIARNTQLILQEETGVTKVIDPLAGSYYVEALTTEMAEKAWELIEEVEAMGGMTKAVASGMPKLRIEESAARRQAAVDRGDEVIVGVNKYRRETEDPIDILDVDNVKVRDGQIARLEKIRATATEPPAMRPSRRWKKPRAGAAICWRPRSPLRAPEPVLGRYPTRWRRYSGGIGPR